jgi:hypothetical protein
LRKRPGKGGEKRREFFFLSNEARGKMGFFQCATSALTVNLDGANGIGHG